MFVDPTRGRSQGFALVAAAGVFALGACTDPEQNTDLRPDGDPEVLAVLVMNDAANKLVESATYCAPNDKKRPAIVGLPDFTAPEVCPADLSKGADPVTNAYPDGWYVRIMFDELLDPSIEELTEILDPDTGEGTDTYTGSIANTRPVKLECESVGGGFVPVEYDGYYSPAGNAVTWPLGPSLVIKPNEPKSIATGKSCRVTLNDNITDKSGNKVPTTQRGAYTFKVAPIQVIAIDPPDDPMGESPIDALQVINDNIYVQFNTFVDPLSLCTYFDPMNPFAGCDDATPTRTFDFSPDVGICSTGGEPCDVSKNGVGCPTAGDTCDSGGFYSYSLKPFGLTDTEFGFGPNNPVEVNKSYTFSFLAGKKVKDRCGVETTFGAPSADNLTLTHYKTKPFGFNKALPGTGDLTSAMRKLELQFNQAIDLSTLVDGTDYTITPAVQVTGAPFTTSTGGNAILRGVYAMNTEYTFTLKAGAKVSDAWGVEYTQAADKVVKWKTQPAITMTTTADKAVVLKAAAGAPVGVTLTFNQGMLASTLTETTDFTITPAPVAGAISVSVGAAPNGCGQSSTGCQLRVRGDFAPGDYTFTLKAGAVINDALTVPTTFTQPADKVIHFTVKNAPAAPPPITCL